MKITPLLDTLMLQKLSDESYFSSKYRNYISNSRLSLIDPEKGGSPERFFAGFQPVYNTSFDMGTCVHCMTLQDDLFEICQDVNKPTAKLGALADRLYIPDKIPSKDDILREAKVIDYYGGKLSEKQINTVLEKCTPYWRNRSDFERVYSGGKQLLYLDEKSRQIALKCVTALFSNKGIMELLHPKGILEDPISENEKAILLDLRVEGKKPFILRLKAKLDNFVIDFDNNKIVVNDVKTISRTVSEFHNNFYKFSYYRELGLYCWLLSLCAKKFYKMKNFTIESNCLVVSTIPDYYTKVYKVSKRELLMGFNEFKLLLSLVVDNIDKCPEFAIWI